MRKINPPTGITSNLLEKLRTKSKNKLDLKKTSGFDLQPEKNNNRNKSTAKKSFVEEKRLKFDEYDSYKSNSKLNNLSKEIIKNIYTSEKANSSNKHLYKVNVNTPSEQLVNNFVNTNLNHNVLSSRTQHIKPNLSTNLSLHNVQNLLPNSPSENKDADIARQTSNFTKFSINTKHKKNSKSVSYQFNISSINMIKQKPNQTNVQTSANLSYEREKEENSAKGKEKRELKKTNIMNKSTDILSLLAASNSKSQAKFSTDSSTKSSVVLSAKSKGFSEMENPEELHYFYVKTLQNNKSLAYKFENEFYDENQLDVSYEF